MKSRSHPVSVSRNMFVFLSNTFLSVLSLFSLPISPDKTPIETLLKQHFPHPTVPSVEPNQYFATPIPLSTKIRSTMVSFSSRPALISSRNYWSNFLIFR